MIKCPNCEGEMKFNVGLQKVKCEYCGSVFTPEELNITLDEKETNTKSEEKDSNYYEGKAYTCSQCGATLMTFDDTAITFCSYCGSQAMLEDKMMKHNNPDFVIPFKKTKEECIEAYKKKVSNFLFAPNDMKSDFTVEKFRGIYMPYCIYNLKNDGIQHNKGSKYAYRRGDYVYYDDYDISADLDVSYDGISFDLVSKFYDDFSTAIPFNYKEAIKFDPSYLIGYYADSFDVNTDTYKIDAADIAQPDVTRRLRKNREFSRYGCSSPKVSFISDKKIGMFPVYFLAIRDKNNENVHYAVVNGQTGKVVVDLPIDFKKYITWSLILSVIMFLVINSAIVLTPIKTIIFSVIASIISLIISFRQLKMIKNRELHLNDKGMNSKNKEQKNIKSERKSFKYLYKSIIAIIISVFLLFSNFVNDMYYYYGTIISLILIVLSFYDLVKEHNMLVSNKLPQLEKRGGDENE